MYSLVQSLCFSYPGVICSPCLKVCIPQGGLWAFSTLLISPSFIFCLSLAFLPSGFCVGLVHGRQCQKMKGERRETLGCFPPPHTHPPCSALSKCPVPPRLQLQLRGVVLHTPAPPAPTPDSQWQHFLPLPSRPPSCSCLSAAAISGPSTPLNSAHSSSPFTKTSINMWLDSLSR